MQTFNIHVLILFTCSFLQKNRFFKKLMIIINELIKLMDENINFLHDWILQTKFVNHYS